ncbi:methionyl aminopeptidase [Clostridium grantii]|uniref:Methionine aminopeptidase n=1 Tax=Clostridium grantii DSM 8605 TaxID=1121316 RepID=A0A1M5UNY2_9CLOT|nr:methionyl aminopeptidase [Clostridium grantii]SHH64659.1 methionine aminopeptidase, type I [Clostridium grantii DSM 8605]
MKEISRNDLCWCGSGKKYKRCHLEMDELIDQLEKKGELVPPKNIILNENEIEGVRKASHITAIVLDKIGDLIKEEVTTNELNDFAHKLTLELGAIPAPLNYMGFPKSICTSINEVVCHGIPENRKLKDGDIINIDVTSIYNGYYGDASRMFIVGNASEEARKLVKVAKECLEVGLNEIKPFATLGDIGFAINKHARKEGYQVVREYGGHGIGHKFHEEPFVDHVGNKGDGMILLPGMVFTVEPMINQGTFRCKVLKDGWTAVTADKKLSAQWEHTVVVTENGYEILTK